MVKIIKGEKPKLYGRIHITVIEKNMLGTEYISEERLFDNLIVDIGKDVILEFFGNVSGSTYTQAEKIGVGNSSQAVSAGDTALIGGSQLIKTIASGDRVYVRPTLFVSVEYGYTDAIFTWNEIALFDNAPTLIARQVDGSPLVKTTSKRAIVEWQVSL